MLFGSIGSVAQVPVRVTLQGSPTPKVAISPFVHNTDSVFAGLQLTGLEPALIVLSNQSDVPILAVSAHWTIVGSDGNEQRSRQRCDTFFTTRRPIVMARAHLMLGPNTCVMENAIPSAAGVLASEKTILNALASASEVRVVVDGLIFENGELAGTDSASYASEINSRITAAGVVANYTRSALVRGDERSRILVDVATASRSRAGDEGVWIRNFATSLSRQPGPYFEAYLQSLERLANTKLIVIK